MSFLEFSVVLHGKAGAAAELVVHRPDDPTRHADDQTAGRHAHALPHDGTGGDH